MYGFLQDVLEEVKDWLSFGGTAQALALANVFNVDENSRKLDPGIADKFHCTVAWLLSSSKRA